MRQLRTLLFLLAGSLLAGACGNVDETPEHTPYDDIKPHSGSRLRARWHVSGDTRAFAGWYDTELEVPCGFQGLDDGYHCIPQAADLLFTDPSCTQPVIANVEEPGLYTLLDYPENACGLNTHAELVRTGEPISKPQALYGGVDCQPMEVGASAQLYAVGERFPVSSTVSARLSNRAMDSRLERSLLITPDGAQEPWSIQDRQLGVLVYLGPGELIPNATEFLSAYSDASCTQSKSQPVTWAPCGTDFAVQAVPQAEGSCGLELRYFRVSSDKPGTTYATPFGFCDDLSDQAYAVGEEIPASDMAHYTTTKSGDGRLQRVSYQSTKSGATFGEFDWYDTRWEVPCEVGAAEDSTLRCLPRYFDAALTDIGVYRDADCTVPVVRPYECDQATFAVDYLTRRFFLITGVDVGPSFKNENGSCEPSAESDVERYTLQAVTPGDFVEVQEITE